MHNQIEAGQLHRSAPTLPSDVVLEYVAEGAANIVYRYSFPAATPNSSADTDTDLDLDLDSDLGGCSQDGGALRNSRTPPPTEICAIQTDPIFQGRLLRLRKALPSSVPNAHAMTLFDDLIAPLLPKASLVSQDLVRLPPSLIAQCNAQLRADERRGTRPPRRHGLFLAEDEPFGLLVTDMTPDRAKDELLIEFKPKWLAQSPTAPAAGTRRCRTCALRAQRNWGKRRQGQKEEERRSSFCPLDLVSTDPERMRRAVRAIINGRAHHNTIASSLANEALERRITTYLLHNSSLLLRLQELQQSLDPLGVLSPGVVSTRDFLKATTLRDCTLFLKVIWKNPPRPPHQNTPNPDPQPQTDTMASGVHVQVSQANTKSGSNGVGDDDGDDTIEARIGDLDLKTPDEGKEDYWRALETSLIEEGWYTATESGAKSSDHDEVCALSRGT
ncbi:MAG: Inositol-pentakisphosphate 2-kinase [Sclerophora amabilis]|nr:MAG: Inositol-pentakisphosphate 2-kinase [Sclerophora amabilis]